MFLSLAALGPVLAPGTSRFRFAAAPEAMNASNSQSVLEGGRANVVRVPDPEGSSLSTAPAVQPQAPARSGREASIDAKAGSYVAMDSWVYPAFDRLAALGLIPSQIVGLRPWTRDECRRQTAEAEQLLGRFKGGLAEEAARLVRALQREFDSGDGAVTLDSIYVRNGVIAGPPLTDSLHFGQTRINDYGRPYGRGWNSYSGFTIRAERGWFFAYAAAEYQRVPGLPPYPLTVRDAISKMDGIPLQPEQPSEQTNRFRAVEAYAGVRLDNIEVSAGKQSLWWGPTYDAPLAFSTNAEPTKNLRIATVHPYQFGGPLRFFGQIRGEFVIGKLGGHAYTWRPWFNAQKLSFKLTADLEVGFTRWSILWGVGHPITMRSFLWNFSSTNSPHGPAGVGADDPGDRKGGFDFRWRVPGLRDWLTLYSDSYCDDDPSPLAAPRRAAISPGISVTHVPGVPRLDFRVEAASTTPFGGDLGGGFIYFNSQYRSGNTNYGTLLGNAVGRDGRTIQGWIRYWTAERSNIELGYRQTKRSGRFLPGGATQSDATGKAVFELASDWRAELDFQCERFWVPVLGGPRTDVSGWMTLMWQPKLPIVGKRNRKER